MSRIIYFATFLKDLSEGRPQRDARHRREYQSTARSMRIWGQQRREDSRIRGRQWVRSVERAWGAAAA